MNYPFLMLGEMLEEYDLRGGVRGKHYRDYRQGHTVKIYQEDGSVTVQEYKPENIIRILVVDDHIVVRKGLVAMLETEADLQVVGEASNGAEAVKLAQELLPDVAIMDLVMPVMDGIEATRQIKAIAPSVNVLVLTSFSTNDKVLPSLNAGAIGYLLKDSSPSELIRAIQQVARGEGSLHPSVTRQVLAQMQASASHSPEEELTEREREVLQHMARGYSNAEIAKLMVVSQATVHTHVSRILAKLNVASRTQAALYALKKGLVSLDEVN